MDWQYHSRWRWFWHNKYRSYNRDLGDYFEHFAGFGPFQFRWWSFK